jgi:hypothetical protein
MASIEGSTSPAAVSCRLSWGYAQVYGAKRIPAQSSMIGGDEVRVNLRE